MDIQFDRVLSNTAWWTLSGLIVCIRRCGILSLVHEALMMIRGGLHYCNRHRAVFRRCGLRRILQSEVETDSRNTKLLSCVVNGRVMQ